MDFLRNAPQPTASNLEHFVVRLMLRPDDIAEIEALIAARRLEQGAEPALAAAAANAVAGVVEESCAPPTGNATTSATCATTTTGAPVSADLVCNGYSTAVHAAASQVAAACSSEVRPDATPPARLGGVGGGGGGPSQRLTHAELHVPVFPERVAGLACMWDCHPFDTQPVGVPVSFDRKTGEFVTTGCFCSISCAAAHNMADAHINSTVRHERHALLGMLAEKERTARGPAGHCPVGLDLAPDRGCLQMFGGNLSIAEFRRSNATVETLKPPPFRPYAVYQHHTPPEEEMTQSTCIWKGHGLLGKESAYGGGRSASLGAADADGGHDRPLDGKPRGLRRFIKVVAQT